MKLSSEAIEDLKKELTTTYGNDFSLNDEEIEEIGLFLLTSLAEYLKLKKSGIIEMLH